MKGQRRRDNRAPRLIIINLEVLTSFRLLIQVKRDIVLREWKERSCKEIQRVSSRFPALSTPSHLLLILAVLKLLKCRKDRAFIHKELLASYIIAPMDPKNLLEQVTTESLSFSLQIFLFSFTFGSPFKKKDAITDCSKCGNQTLL